jgi:hypothetical protein
MGILIAYKHFMSYLDFSEFGWWFDWSSGYDVAGYTRRFFCWFFIFRACIALIIMGDFHYYGFFFIQIKNLPVPSIHFDSRIFLRSFSLFIFFYLSFFIPIIYFPTKMSLLRRDA